MITRNRPNFKRLARDLGKPLAALLFWDIAIVMAFKVLGWDWVASEHIPLALYGSAIGIVVGFRNNSAYSRWWEARTLWGSIVNNSRNLARQMVSLANPESQALQREILYLQIGYIHALREQLRGNDPIPEVKRVLPDLVDPMRGQKNVAMALQREMGARLREGRRTGLLDHWEWQQIDGSLSELANAQGGSERIKNTPLPLQYDFFVLLFVHAYCLLLPIGMVEKLGWFTPLGSTLVGFMFLALNRIGSSLEDPFQNAPYDVPLTAITTNIETNLRQMLDEKQLPAPIIPEDGILW